MPEPTSQRRTRLTWLLPLAFAMAVAALYFLSDSFREIVTEGYEVVASGDERRVRQWVRGYGAAGVAVLLGLMLMQSIVAVLPSLVTIVAAVVAYGPVSGALLAFGGMLMTASFMFGVGRSVGPLAIERFVGAKTQRRVRDAEERYGGWAIVAARLTPILSTDAVSFVAGAIGMRYRKFIAATAAGTLPLILLVAWLGRDMQRLKTGLVVVSIAAAVFFAAAFFRSRLRSRLRRTAPAA